MRRTSISILGLLLVASCSSSLEPTGNGTAAATSATTGRVIATLQLTDFRTQLGELAHRYDVAGVDLESSQVDLVLDRAELPALGLTVVRTLDAAATESALTASDYPTPDGVAALLHEYATRYPTLAAVRSVGTSGEGRDIWAIRITKDVGTHDPKRPVILFNGAHHAREVMSVQVPLDTIDTLLTGYGTDPKITHWVDSNEIWVLPMFNVDGSNRVFTTDQLWRKNTDGCPASGTCASGTGVDINRNYPYGWASCDGSSTSTSADDYHGPSAGSEAETKTMMGFVTQIRPVFDISYHSYSELVLYPYGCDGQHVPSAALVADIGGKMAAKLPLDATPTRSYQAGSPWELLYSADGGDMDWMFHERSVLAYAIEVNGSRAGFHPAYSTWRDKTVTKLRGAWELLLDRLDGSGVRGFVHDAGGAITDASVTVTSSSTNEARPANADGTFHVVTLPGTYHVTVAASGHTTFTQDVTVADTRVDLDITL